MSGGQFIAVDWGTSSFRAALIDSNCTVLGRAMSERMTAQLTCDALQMGLWRRRMPTGVVVHSDRGNQYCSGAYLPFPSGPYFAFFGPGYLNGFSSPDNR